MSYLLNRSPVLSCIYSLHVKQAELNYAFPIYLSIGQIILEFCIALALLSKLIPETWKKVH